MHYKHTKNVSDFERFPTFFLYRPDDYRYLCGNQPQITMGELTLYTPSILFSAISLILLAYTNRFLQYAQIVRNLASEFRKNPDVATRRQIENLRKRLYLIRSMQILGISSLFLCVICTLFIYVGWQTMAVWTFGAALVSLIASLGITIREIVISVRALEIHLESMEK